MTIVRSVGLLKMTFLCAIVDDDEVEHVERVETELEIAVATQADVPGNREVHRMVGAATEEEPPRLQADTAVLRTGDGGRVELLVLVARTTGPRIADIDDLVRRSPASPSGSRWRHWSGTYR